MVKKILISLIVIIFSLAIFAPKRELYYLLEEQLMREDIIIHNEAIEGGLFTLTLKHPELYFKGIKVAKIQEVKLFSLLFYTSIMAKEIKVDSSLSKFMPTQIDKVSALFQLWEPKKVMINVLGDFGYAQGYLSLDESKMHLDLIEEKSIKPLKPMLQKGEKGWYYETSF